MLYVFIVLGLCSIVFTLALCRAAGRADQWIEKREYRKNQ